MRSFAEAYPHFVQARLAQLNKSNAQPATAKTKNTNYHENASLKDELTIISWTTLE